MRDRVACRMRCQRLLTGGHIRRTLDARSIQLLRAFRTVDVLNNTRHGRQRARRLGLPALPANMAIVICCRHTNTPTQTPARRIALMADHDRNVLTNRNCGIKLPSDTKLVTWCGKNPAAEPPFCRRAARRARFQAPHESIKAPDRRAPTRSGSGLSGSHEGHGGSSGGWVVTITDPTMDSYLNAS
jgi:hypothetical protein